EISDLRRIIAGLQKQIADLKRDNASLQRKLDEAIGAAVLGESATQPYTPRHDSDNGDGATVWAGMTLDQGNSRAIGGAKLTADNGTSKTYEWIIAGRIKPDSTADAVHTRITGVFENGKLAEFTSEEYAAPRATPFDPLRDAH